MGDRKMSVLEELRALEETLDMAKRAGDFETALKVLQRVMEIDEEADAAAYASEGKQLGFH